MDAAAFERELAERGYRDIAVREWEPDRTVPEHMHPFDARVLVLEGEVTVAWEGRSRTCRAGEIFELRAGVVHMERYGPSGAKFLSGRRPAAGK